MRKRYTLVEIVAMARSKAALGERYWPIRLANGIELEVSKGSILTEDAWQKAASAEGLLLCCQQIGRDTVRNAAGEGWLDFAEPEPDIRTKLDEMHATLRLILQRLDQTHPQEKP